MSRSVSEPVHWTPLTVGNWEGSLNLPLVTAIAPVVKISFIRGKQYKQKCALVLNFLLGGRGDVLNALSCKCYLFLRAILFSFAVLATHSGTGNHCVMI